MFEKLFNSLVTINSALRCPRCKSDCISQYPKHFMIQTFENEIRSYIMCPKCDWETTGNELERSLFCK